MNKERQVLWAWSSSLFAQAIVVNLFLNMAALITGDISYEIALFFVNIILICGTLIKNE